MAEVEQFKQNQNVINEEEKQQLEALNRSLFATIAEYTKIRNEHAKLIESQLCPIRCDIERRIRSADLAEDLLLLNFHTVGHAQIGTQAAFIENLHFEISKTK
uniref:Uncharacterized protein n=1 Tax=Meloidogyne javanica TaxID=6303 RepID=A0A915M451_MELJA